ncbi:MAG: hypothetical protein WCH34_01745 [Bacteroidota bacterium]
MNSTVLQKSISKVFPNKAVAMAIEILFLLLIGALAVTLHAKLRIPMHIPGRQGVLFIALLISARGMSRFPYATIISGMGASALLLTGALGFHDPFLPMIYLMLGAVMDVMFTLMSKLSSNIFIISFAGAVSWMFIPFARLIFSGFTTFESQSFAQGIYLPFLTHFLFGYLGALAGLGLVKLLDKQK